MPLAIYTSAAWTANGGLEPASQALVTVRNEATGALASVFSDRAGNNGESNPFNADDQGRFSFYASGGAYRIEVESDGLTQELRYQAIGTSKEHDVTANGGDVVTAGQTESVTLSSGTLTIPVGMSTIKLPTTVWDGSSNITISAIEFENGVQPAVGYEFSVVVPKTTDVGSLTAGALGNEVLVEHGSSILCEANNDSSLPCYPNAADNPDQDAVQFAAPYYRLDFRVDSYDGSDNPAVSLIRLPGDNYISNDRGQILVKPTGLVFCNYIENVDLSTSNFFQNTFPISVTGNVSGSFSLGDGTQSNTTSIMRQYENIYSVTVGTTRWQLHNPDTPPETVDVTYSMMGEWY